MRTPTSEVSLKLRRTKIVATIGNVSGSLEMLEKLIDAGMNVARLNFSHGTHETHLQVIKNIRKASEELDKPVAILGDLCGPKIRVGEFVGGKIALEVSQRVIITTEQVQGKPQLIPSQYPQLIQDIREGQKILLDDGKLELEVEKIVSETRAECRVLRGGVLKDRKGMNIPGSPLSVPAVTEKDREDLLFCLENNLDYIALSFVRKAKEIEGLKEDIKKWTQQKAGGEQPEDEPNRVVETRVIAKIEKPEAMNEIVKIIDASDGIMVARGDLGVEVPLEKVPIIQNQLIQMAHHHNRPVIVATQMLESMTENFRPTRAEVSDVANAVLASTDAVMLSGETASGKYPVESIETMDSVIREIENYQWEQGRFGKMESDISIYPLPNAMARACTLLSQDMEIRAVNVLTNRGAAARIMSASRPNAPILGYCNNRKIANQMLLYWGVVPIYHEGDVSFEKFTSLSNEIVKKMGIAVAGHYILLLSCPALSQPGKHTNSIVLHQVD